MFLYLLTLSCLFFYLTYISFTTFHAVFVVQLGKENGVSARLYLCSVLVAAAFPRTVHGDGRRRSGFEQRLPGWRDGLRLRERLQRTLLRRHRLQRHQRELRYTHSNYPVHPVLVRSETANNTF